MGFLKSTGTVIIYIGLFLAVITFLPGIPPEAEFSEYSIKLPSDVQNRFELKNRLRGAEVLFSGEIKGPECFASYNGELYTGIRGGYVVKIEENRIVPIVKFGKKCDGLWQEEKCGRPLGLKFNDKGYLFVADAYYGIFKVNVNTGQYTNIVNSSEPIDGKVPRIVNSLDIAKNGDIYWTDSSTEFSIHDGTYSFLSNPSGRLIRYNAATKKNEVLVKNLGFANGVLLSDDESFVIALECLTSRIIKYNLKGPKAGQQEVFAETLPGMPDNVHTDGQGGFLVSLIMYIDPQYPSLPQSLAPHPYIRKMFARLLYSIEAPFKLLQDVYPNYYSERILHSVGSFDVSKLLDVKRTSIVLRMDKAGNVLDALYSEDEKVHGICSAYIHKGYLWLGSPYNENIMRVPLKQAFPDLSNGKESSNVKEQKQKEPPVVAAKMPNTKTEAKPTNAKPKVQEAAAKPTVTTTTPKPVTKAPATQKPAADTRTPKPTTQKVASDTTTEKPTVQKSAAAQQSSTTTSSKSTTSTKEAKPEKEVKKDNSKEVKTDKSKEVKKDNPKEIKKDNPKEVKKDNPKEVKKDNSKEVKNENVKQIKKDTPTNSNANAKTSNVKTESTKKRVEATDNSKSDESVKKNVRDTRSEKSKPVEKKGDSTK